MSVSKHLDKNNLHHAYLIEGKREEVLPEISKFLESVGFKTEGNSDFLKIEVDSFKIENARNLKSYSTEKSFGAGRKIFVITANSFLLEAQNSLLKMFEEPIPDTHFFLIVPDQNALLKTFVSRFYVVKREGESKDTYTEAEEFISMPLKNKIDFIKDMLAEVDEKDDEGNEIEVLDSTRSKALNFLNHLETALHERFVSRFHLDDTKAFEHIFKVREFLRMPGSSAKNLLESVALIMPVIQ